MAGAFRPSDLAIALLSTGLVQAALFWVLFSASSSAVRANISDDNARPIAVAITPVSSLATARPAGGALPRAWQRHTRGPSTDVHAGGKTAHPAVPPSERGAEETSPSPPTEPNPSPPDPDSLGAAQATAQAQDPARDSDASPFASSSADDGDGDSDSDRGDGLKARAINLYRAELVSWFMSKFEIRGKLPFDLLRGLRAVAAVSLTADHTVTGYHLIVVSGNPVFDAQVRASLAGIEESGAPLPPPPPLYPELLGNTLSVSFQCTARKDCE